MSTEMGDKQPTSAPRAPLEHIEACLARNGKADWAEHFVALVAMTQAVQLMVFGYTDSTASCLLSRNFRQRALGTRLAEDYLDGWFARDPLFGRILALDSGELEIVGDAAVAAQMSEEYRQRFFRDPQLHGKRAALIAGERLRLAVNCYWDAPATPDCDSLLALLGRLALLHFEAQPEYAYPAPLAVLSERERAVCLGMLAGKKAEQIAGDLQVAPSSVVTYRRRAYQKLGVSSRGGLFAICRA